MNFRVPPMEIDSARAAVYGSAAIVQVPRLLNQLDREAHSQTAGSFDREHWGWKFRDFPITMFQAAIYPLALLYRLPLPGNPYYQNPIFLEWLLAAIENTCRRQHRNGAFDSVAPYTQDHGVSLAIVYILTETSRILEDQLSPQFRDLIIRTVRRSCEFALKSREDYAFITNHQAQFALALLNASALLEEPAYFRRAEDLIDRIIAEQSPDGWYREYEGPDPGYESLGVSFLAAYWTRTASEKVLGSLRRSIDFYAHFVHPDGSIGGSYGSRHTSLYFPAGFEILASEIPMAASIAGFMRGRLWENNVLTPTQADPENLIPLVSSYLEACLGHEVEYPAELPPLPHESLDGVQDFQDSLTTAAGTQHYYAVVNASKGGVCRVFDKHSGKIAYEDAGYLVRKGGRLWSSQFLGLGRREEGAQDNEIVCLTTLARVRQDVPSPLKFILLRILNLTLFRSLALGIWLRRRIIARLITKAEPGPFHLRRSLTFTEDEIQFHDRLEAAGPGPVDYVDLPRSFTAIHMGSAKYFHPADLASVPRAMVAEMAEELRLGGLAQCAFGLHFSSTSEPKLVAARLIPMKDAATKEVVTA